MRPLRTTSNAAVFSIGLGIAIGLISSLIQSLGLTLQRKSHVLNQRLPTNQQKPEYRRPLWLLGSLIFVTSNLIGSLVQIASLPVVILAPLGAISLLWNALFARLLLGDVFSKRLVIGTILITGGAVLIAFFGIVPDSEKERNLEELLRLWQRGPFIGWFSTECFIVFVCLVITHIIDFSHSRRLRNALSTPSRPPSPVDIPSHPSALTIGVNDTIASAIPSEDTPLLHLGPTNKSKSYSTASSIASSVISIPPSKVPLFLSISYASISGIISGACLLLAKSGVSLLLLTIGGDNQFKSAGAWLIIVGLVVCALGQLWYLHKALVLAAPTIVCPSAFCFYNVSSILNGLIYFDQFALISSLYLGLVSLGTAVLLAGVWIVSVQPDGEGIAIDVWETESEGISDVEAIAGEPVDSTPGRTTVNNSPHQHPENPFDTWPQPSTHLGIERSPSLYETPRRRPSVNINTSIPHHRRYSTAPLSPTGVGLGGLQIGLSAVSPGFAIRPEQRGTRRRQSSLQTDENARPTRRRTVSDGPSPLDGESESQYQSPHPTPAEPPKPKHKRWWQWSKK